MKTSFLVVALCCVATLAILSSTDNGIPGINLFRADGVSDGNFNDESSFDDDEELLTPLPDEARGLTKILSRLHTTTVRAFESVPFPFLGRWRSPTMTLLDEPLPPKHVPEVAFVEAMSQSDGAAKTQTSPNEAWLWLQLMYGVTDRGFVYRSLDLRPDTVNRSQFPVNTQGIRPDWRGTADSKLTDKERKGGDKMVVGFPTPVGLDVSSREPNDYHIALRSSTPMTSKDRIWRIRQVELVSLLQHDLPVVYVDPGPPNDVSVVQNSLRLVRSGQEEIPTRSLNEMEEASLEALMEGKDRVLAWNESEQRLQLLGAIRAKDACLKCHEVKRGDLLGAFTYWIEEEGKSPARAALSQDESP